MILAGFRLPPPIPCKHWPPFPRATFPVTRSSQNAMNLLTVAWRQRAYAWKPLEDDPAVRLA